MSKQISDLKLQVVTNRNQAIRASIKRQLKEQGKVDPDIVFEDLWEHQPYMEALEAMTHRQVGMIRDSVEEEVEEEAHEHHLEQQHKQKLKSGLNSGTRRELSRMGADVK